MRRIVLYGIIVFQILLIISLVRGIQLSQKSSSRVDGLEQTKTKLQEEQAELRLQEAEVNSPEYLEKVAREELHLSKPGETVVIMPENVVVKTEAEEDNQRGIQNEPIWKRWIMILSGKI